MQKKQNYKQSISNELKTELQLQISDQKPTKKQEIG